MRRLFLFFILLSLAMATHAQQSAIIHGVVNDRTTNDPIDFVTIYVKNTSTVTESSVKGRYSLKVNANERFTLVFSRIGYKEAQKTINAVPENGEKYVDVKLVPIESDLEVVVTENRIDEAGMVRETVEELKLIPSTSGNFESILPHIALGASGGTGGELSSQYNVRGGNYDENLVYVNDFEIFRPQLIRNSQQEGLSFPNINLIRDLTFSSGGFEAKYGDKMSSVLDIRYKRPDEFKGSAEVSFLGLSTHIEGSKQIGPNSYNKFRYLIGARYKTSRYLLGSLETQGQYTPNFTDLQGYFTYDINKDLQLGLIGNYNRSEFDFVPRSRATTIGLIDFAIRFTSDFEGKESDRFTNGMTGLSLTYLPEREENPLFLKFLASNYIGEEIESFDIIGTYQLNQIETGLGSENAGENIALLGAGTQQQFARNRLANRITNVQHKGGIEFSSEYDNVSSSNFIQWGAKVQNEKFVDRLNEWERLDSAGYSLPFTDQSVEVFSTLKSERETNSLRYSAHVQNTFTKRVEDKSELKFSAGTRIGYWDLNQEFIISPRAQMLYKPLSWQQDVSFKFAAGLYYQPPFYREMRRPDGSLNTDLKSQKSLHIVSGFTYDFLMPKVSDKKFKLISELYYKKLSNLSSYEIDNVRIRYSGENNATGYIAGADFRINGEFVPGAESWINLSILKAKESLDGVQHTYRAAGDSLSRNVDFVPRPTDQFVTASIFFQDYLPRNENFKMHLNLVFGSGLPFGLQGRNIVSRNNFRYKPYQRVDLGFSWLLWNKDWINRKPHNPFRTTENVWMSLEIFNLMGIENVASNTWIKTIFESQFAIPNNLTSRRINLRVKVDF